MSTTKKIRQILGVTQQQLADYLSVNRTQVAMAESGHRELPTAALLKLEAIDRHLAVNAPARTAKELQKQSAQAKSMLRAEAQKYNKMAGKAAKKLASLRSQHQECLKALQTISGLLAELPSGAASKKDRLWLELAETEALQRMADCGIGAQAVLQLQADVFLYHARRAQETTL